MLKRLFIAAVVTLLLTCFSTSVFAHSHFEGSNPADGDVVTEQLNEIVLEFDGQIEQGSYIEVTTTSGESVEIQDIVISDATLTGTVTEPLANDDYHVYWNIISADGHPLEGEFAFTVTVEGTEPAEEEELTETETVEEEEAEEPTETEVIEDGELTDSAEQLTEEEESSSMIGIVIGALVVIVIIAFFLLRRKK